MATGVQYRKLVVRLQTGICHSMVQSGNRWGEELANWGLAFVQYLASALPGAASELGVEYTVAKSAITRIRPDVHLIPERESLESFAAHQTSMAIFLSVKSVRSWSGSSTVVTRFQPQSRGLQSYLAGLSGCEGHTGRYRRAGPDCRSVKQP